MGEDLNSRVSAGWKILDNLSWAVCRVKDGGAI